MHFNYVRSTIELERCSNEPLELLCKKVSEELRKKLYDITFLNVTIDRIENTDQLIMCIHVHALLIDYEDVLLIKINSFSCYQKAIISSCSDYAKKASEVFMGVGFTEVDSYRFDSLDYEY